MEEEIVIDIADFVKGNELSPDEQEAIAELYNSIYDKKINSDNLLYYVMLLMKLVDVFENIENVDKKKLVIFVLDKYIDINISNNDEATFMKSFVDKFLGNLIDAFVSLDKKEIILKTENYLKTTWEKIHTKLCIV